jgi:HD superfamily phosphohydrolase
MPNLSAGGEELGYFYDTIHGRFALEELPTAFRPVLKAALSSQTLARLKGISQLGHTSVSFFSATHTRFSHAIGTMLVMDKLYRRLIETKGFPANLHSEVERRYLVDGVFGDISSMLHCHLLLVALYQDAGELPFQKVTSLHFRPALSLQSDDSRRWTGKQVFSVRALIKDLEMNRSAFAGYNRDFLVYLMTTRATSVGQDPLGALLQMVDGFAIDADRLDYVYRDSLATIGSLSRPNTVIESIVGYEPDRVVVNDPRPVTDFLSTRMRLFTFVYNSADVRFRQSILKTILEGYWDGPKAQRSLDDAGLGPELTDDDFMRLDDNDLLSKIARLKDGHLRDYRKRAREVLLRAIPEYEYRILRRPSPLVAARKSKRLPADVFFDILADHGHHQLYRPRSVQVNQRLTGKIDQFVPLEESAGAFSPLFVEGNSPMLVPGGFYIFLPQDWQHKGKEWESIEEAISSGTIFQRVQWEDAWRHLSELPLDTLKASDFSSDRAISISFCSDDFPTVVSLVRELFTRKRRYRLFLDRLGLQGTGKTVEQNSQKLIDQADAVLAVCSTSYLNKYSEKGSYVGIEIRAMHRRAGSIPLVPLPLDARDDLEKVEGWKWEYMNEDWRDGNLVLSNSGALRAGSDETIRKAIDAALEAIDHPEA